MKRSLLVAAMAACAMVACAAVASAAPVPPFDTNQKCLECHSVGQPGAFTEVDFEVAAVDYSSCAACHAAPRRIGHIHLGYLYCGDCHDDEAAFAFPEPSPAPVPVSPFVPNLGPFVRSLPASYRTLTPYGWFASSVSASATPSQLHAIHTGENWVQTDLTSLLPECASCHAKAACTTCHAGAAGHGRHGESQYPGPVVTQATGTSSITAPLNCLDAACHATGVGGIASSPPACLSCHAERVASHGYESVDHVAADGSVEGIACTACHALDLKTEHDKASSSSAGRDCTTCHPDPRSTVGEWDQSCVTAGCHTVDSSAPFHAATGTAHEVVSAGEVCLDCHEGDELGSIHADASVSATRTSCLVCHDATSAPTTNDCTVCHFTFEGHYDEVKHQSTWTLDGCVAGGCHSSRDLMSVHNDHRTAADGEFTCAGCHDSTRPAVVSAIAAGLTGCGDCHAGVSPTQGHRAIHWSDPLLQDASGPKYSYYTGSMGDQPTGDCAGCHVSNVIDEHMGIVDADTGNPIRLPRKDRNGAALTCASCHDSTDINVRAAIVAGETKCDACHVTHGPVQQVHASTFMDEPPVSCAASGCHTSSLVAEHNGTYTVTTPSGQTLTGCDVCHAYYETPRGPVVQDAIDVNNDARCSACHDGLIDSHPDLGGHTATSAASLDCGACHADGASVIDIQVVHAGASAGACAVCHSNPSRVPDISAETPECASCHAAEGTDFHRGLPGKHVYSAMLASCQSSGCHVSNVLPSAHQGYVDGTPAHETTCDVCHANPDPDRIPADATAACDSCHAPIHANMDHTADASQECVGCHETGDVTAIHKKADGSVDCDACHANPTRVPALPETADCINCHAGVSPADPNHYQAAPHAASNGMEASLACTQCHSLDMKSEHAGIVTCVECHEVKVDGFAAAWDKSCAACHSTKHADISVAHAGVAPANNTCVGSYCHPNNSTDLRTVHTDVGCAITGCHAAGSTPGVKQCATCHPGYVDGHKSSGPIAEPYDSCTGTGCHTLSTDIHGLATHPEECASCHDLAAELACVCHDKAQIHSYTTHKAAACATCHPSGTSMPHGIITPKLTTTSTRSQWRAVCDDCHGYVHDRGTCTGCHSLTKLHSLDSEHVDGNSDCRKCHNIPSADLTDPCLTCHPKGAPAVTPPGSGATPGPVAEPYGGCTNCHAVNAEVHRVAAHPKECMDCHGVAQADACSCHTETAVHAVSQHASADCATCHESGVPKPHVTITVKTTSSASRSTWIAACDDCHSRPHDRGTCSNCHSTSGLHGEASNHVDSNSDCKSCHGIQSADLSWNCLACHKNLGSSSGGSDGGGSWGGGGW